MGRPKKIKPFDQKETIKKVKKYIDENFIVTLNTSGNSYEGSGVTADEAIASLGISWDQIKAKGVVTLVKGKETVEHLFYLGQLKKIFANKTTRAMWAKRLTSLLK